MHFLETFAGTYDVFLKGNVVDIPINLCFCPDCDCDWFVFRFLRSPGSNLCH